MKTTTTAALVIAMVCAGCEPDIDPCVFGEPDEPGCAEETTTSTSTDTDTSSTTSSTSTDSTSTTSTSEGTTSSTATTTAPAECAPELAFDVPEPAPCYVPEPACCDLTGVDLVVLCDATWEGAPSDPYACTSVPVSGPLTDFRECLDTGVEVPCEWGPSAVVCCAP